MLQIDVPSTSANPTTCECGHCQNYGGKKRLASDNEVVVSPKRFRYYYRLASDSSEDETEGAESIYSIQGYETELVMDTPDTDTKSESNADSDIEYDVRSSSENEDFFVVNDSSSGGEDILPVVGAIATAVCDEPSPETCVADGEESDISITPLFPTRKIEYKNCILCKLRNTNPLFRYCKKCFQVRKTFFPTRPKRFKKKKAKSFSKQSNSKLLSKSANLSHENNAEIDMPSTSSLGSSGDQQLSSEEKENASSQSTQNKVLGNKELCIMCNAESKNSIFLHGSTAHMCCCYRCASKTWKMNKKCPACNKKAQNVIKVFVI